MQKKHDHVTQHNHLKLVVNRTKPLITEKPYAQVYYFVSDNDDFVFTFDNY